MAYNIKEELHNSRMNPLGVNNITNKIGTIEGGTG